MLIAVALLAWLIDPKDRNSATNKYHQWFPLESLIAYLQGDLTRSHFFPQGVPRKGKDYIAGLCNPFLPIFEGGNSLICKMKNLFHISEDLKGSKCH